MNQIWQHLVPEKGQRVKLVIAEGGTRGFPFEAVLHVGPSRVSVEFRTREQWESFRDSFVESDAIRKECEPIERALRESLAREEERNGDPTLGCKSCGVSWRGNDELCPTCGSKYVSRTAAEVG